MSKVFAALAVAAALIPSAFAGVTDCNINRVTIMKQSDRGVVADVSTDYDYSRYDYNINEELTSSNLVLAVTQPTESEATFAVTLNDQLIGSDFTSSDAVNLSGAFDIACGNTNVLIIEAVEKKAVLTNGIKAREDSCRFKYEIDYHNTC